MAGGGAQVTYPLDTLRLRLAVDPAARSLRGAALALLREGSYAAFFRGLGASMLGEALRASGLAARSAPAHYTGCDGSGSCGHCSDGHTVVCKDTFQLCML